MMMRWLFGLRSRPGASARLSTLIYHRVLPRPDPLFPDVPDAARFSEQMRWVKGWFNVLPLGEAVERLQSASLPARALAISLDDGYADNATVAAPILRSLGLPATVFVASGFLDGGRMWNDTVIEAIRRWPDSELDLGALGMGQFPVATPAGRRAAIDAVIRKIRYLPQADRQGRASAIQDLLGQPLPTDLMMTSEQVRGLPATGVSIGAHTHTHPILARLQSDRAREEIACSREVLRSLMGEEITLFAYPNGKPEEDYRAEHVSMVRALGFRAAFSTAWGVSARDSDLFQLPRFTPWDVDRFRFAARMLGNLGRNRYELAAG